MIAEVNFDVLKSTVANSPKRNSGLKSNVIVSFPDADGILNSFSVYENSNMDPALEANYPDIKSYVGIGINDPSAIIYFSMSPLGLQTMQINANKSAVIIEPYTTDNSCYAVYNRADKTRSLSNFDCSVVSAINNGNPIG